MLTTVIDMSKTNDLFDQFLDVKSRLDAISESHGPYDDFRGKKWKLIKSKYSESYYNVEIEGLEGNDMLNHTSINVNDTVRMQDLVFARACVEHFESMDFFTFVFDADKEITDE